MSRMTLYRTTAATIIVGALLLTVGCSAEPDRSGIVKSLAEEARAAGSPENAALLEDGEITNDEYFTAARSYQACIRETGVIVPDPVMNPVDGVTLVFDTTEILQLAGKNATKSQECDAQWQPVLVSYTSTHTFKMDPALLEAVTTCLEKHGYTVPDDASKVADIIGDPGSDGGKQRGTAENCVYAEAEALYPDSPGFVFSY